MLLTVLKTLTCFYRHHRVLLELCLSYRLISSSMGLVAGSSAAVDRALGHDTCECICSHRRDAGCDALHHLRNVVRLDNSHSMRDGRHKRYAALAPSALGRSDEQAFRGRRCGI